MILESAILIASIIVIVSYLIWYCCFYYWPLIKAANSLPGPKMLPFVGTALYFLRSNFDDLLGKINKFADFYPSPFHYWFGNTLIIFLSDPDHIKIITQSCTCLTKSKMYKIHEALLGTGLFTAHVPLWKIHRKAIAPIFISIYLRNFVNVMIDQSLIFMEELKKIALYQNKIDLSQHIKMCTLAIIFETSMSIKLDLKSEKHKQFIEVFDRIKESFTYRMQNIFLYSDILFYLTSLGRQQCKDISFIQAMAEEIINKKRAELSESNTIKDNKKATSKMFIDILMENPGYNKINAQQKIRDEVITLLFGGSDTTAIMINFAIFMLANFPEMQEEVYAEMLEIYGKEDPKSVPVKYEDLQHMVYMECFIKEVLRFFPVGPLISRLLTENINIGTGKYVLGKYTIPKGAEIVIMIMHMHRNEKYWPNPLKFDPDRFLPENSKNHHPYSYIPFSHGFRDCIGSKYAMMSMKIMLATLVRAFVFRVDKSIEIDDIKLNVKFLLNTVDPLKVRVERRDLQ